MGFKDLRSPDGLNTVGAKEWARVVKELNATNFVDEKDRQALFVYCEAVQEFDYLLKRLAKEDHVAMSANGALYQHPLVGAKNKAAERLIKTAKEFGLTPWARSKMDVLEKEAKDEFANFLKNG